MNLLVRTFQLFIIVIMKLRDINNPDKTLQPLIDEIKEYEKFVEDLIVQAMELSTRISNVANELKDVGKQVSDFGRKTGDSSLAKTGSIVQIGAEIWRQYKEHILQKRTQENLEKLQEKRKELVRVKLYAALTRRHNFSKSLEYLSSVFRQHSFEEIDLSESTQMVTMRVDICRSSFLTYAKALYLDSLLAYVINEMQSWTSPQMAKSISQPSEMMVVNQMVASWRTDTATITKKVEQYILDVHIQYMPAWVLLICSEPYLLMKYVGIELPGYALKESKNKASIKVIDNHISDKYMGEEVEIQHINPVVMSILSNNEYYQHCEARCKAYEGSELKYNFTDLLLFVGLWIISAGCGFVCVSTITIMNDIQWYWVAIVVLLLLLVLYLSGVLCFKLLSPLNKYKKHIENCMQDDLHERNRMTHLFNMI